MKVVILAGGLGTRLSEETGSRPKPMVEIGGKPILWHIMKIYSHYGYKDFIVCLGYKGYFIKEWFSHYAIHNCDITFDLRSDTVTYHKRNGEDWRVTLVDTGEETMTGGRIKRIKDYIAGENFMVTYGDGVSDIDINKLVAFHNAHGKIATLTAAKPDGRYGILKFDGDLVSEFVEKRDRDNMINGGFFVLKPEVFDYISGDEMPFEQDPLSNLARDRELAAYRHEGFWFAMDKLSDKMKLEQMWQSGNPPWRIWDTPLKHLSFTQEAEKKTGLRW